MDLCLNWNTACLGCGPGASVADAASGGTVSDGTSQGAQGGAVVVNAPPAAVACPDVTWFWIASAGVALAMVVQPFNR